MQSSSPSPSSSTGESPRLEYAGRYRIKIVEKKEIFTKFTVYNSASSSFTFMWLAMNILAIIWFFFRWSTLDIAEILSHSLDSMWSLVPIVLLNLVLLNYHGNLLKKESLIITKNIGVSIERKKLNGRTQREFYSVQNIRDLVINEGLTPYDVKYYMVIIAKDSESLIHLFSAFDLRLDDLLKIFYPARKEILSDVQKK